MVSARKLLNANLTMFTKLNYHPSFSHARPNKLHCITQQAIDYKSVWGFLKIPIGC